MNTNEQKTHKKPAATPKHKRAVGVYVSISVEKYPPNSVE